MPEANVVGVEVGSVVRARPDSRAGKDLRHPRAAPLRGKTATCTAAVRDPGPNGLRRTSTTRSPRPVDRGARRRPRHLLAISGCGGRAFLPTQTAESDCGPGWKPDVGNFKGSVLVLKPTAQTNGLPVQSCITS